MTLSVAQYLDTTSSCLMHAQQVLHNESEALKALSQTLDENFEKAVNLIQMGAGRLIVTGIGKSGHVARKIAATFASTGQPAFYLHPAEASHGDLGMVTPQDVILALSNSGETLELSSLINYCKRFDISIIAMTKRQQSTLAQVATIGLIVPDYPEACPMGLAPTTSTTMMMALGDALAIALLSKRGFSAHDFKVFHPGGNLGTQLCRVGEKMHTGNAIPLSFATDAMSDVLVTMSSKGFGCAGIVNDEGGLIGVITDGDLRRHMHDGLLNEQAYTIMTKNPLVIKEDMLMSEALQILNKQTKTCLFIVQEVIPFSKPVGIIHVHDFLRAGTI